MKRVILTGATGFVGANLARRLLSEGHEVHLFLRQAHQTWRIDEIQPHLRVHLVNLNDPDDVERATVAIRPDWIFHLAAYGAYSSQTDLRRMAEINLVATANLVDACVKLGFEAFINTGSSSEYGYKDHAPLETEWIEPNSPYAVTKAAATHYCRFVAQAKNANLATVRLYSVFGPYEEPTRLIPTLILEGLRGKLPPLVNPAIARDYIYSDDVSDAYLTLASNPAALSGKVYNLGSGVQTSLQEVVEIARRELAIEAAPAWGSMANRGWDTSIWVANIENLTRETGWRPLHSFSAGFVKTIEWLTNHPRLLTHYQTHREVPR